MLNPPPLGEGLGVGVRPRLASAEHPHPASPLLLAFGRASAEKRMMFKRLFLVLAALMLPLSASAQTLEGSWDMRVDGTTVFRFTIEEGMDGEWLGQWQRPASFNSDGNAFYNMRGGVKTSPSMTGILFQGTVELAFDDPRPGAIPDIFRFRQTGPDSAEMTYVGTDLAPYPMVRAAASDTIGNWDAARIYRRTVPGARGEEVLPAVEEPAGEPTGRIGRDFLEGL